MSTPDGRAETRDETVEALRAEVAALRLRVAELAADRDDWRARREGGC